MILPAGRLFWKLYLAIWGALLVSFVMGYFCLLLTGERPTNEGPSWLPFVPLASGTVICLLFGAALAWYLARPLRLLSSALRAAANSRFDVRVLPLLGSRRDEIVDLAREFDGMALQLQRASEQQRRLLHDISHELRSPLARIQAAIGLIQQEADFPEPLIGRIVREAKRLDSLVEELLTLHTLEAGATGKADKRIDIVELLAAIAEDAAFEAQARNCTVSLRAPPAFVAEVDGELIYRALENIVRNAVKYTATGTSVEITAYIEDIRHDDGAMSRTLEITIEDQGPGVPADLCDWIFEPFRRVETTTHSEHGNVVGTGLGLAIARRAIVLHGGSIVAQPRSGVGLRVITRIPAERPKTTAAGISVDVVPRTS